MVIFIINIHFHLHLFFLLDYLLILETFSFFFSNLYKPLLYGRAWIFFHQENLAHEGFPILYKILLNLPEKICELTWLVSIFTPSQYLVLFFFYFVSLFIFKFKLLYAKWYASQLQWLNRKWQWCVFWTVFYHSDVKLNSIAFWVIRFVKGEKNVLPVLFILCVKQNRHS